MNLLAIDTSTDHCSVALWRDGALSDDGVRAGQRHSELLLPMMQRLLAAAGLRLADLDALAYGEGPGSFTGLRIACGVVQGLAFGTGLPVVAVGTLAALAEAAGEAQVACCLDARMKEVYYAAYRRDGDDWSGVVEPGLYAPDALPPLPGAGWIGCGNGFAAYPEAVVHALGPGLQAVRDAQAVPHAVDIAALAARRFAREGGRPAQEALPLYLRDKVALTIEEQR